MTPSSRADSGRTGTLRPALTATFFCLGLALQPLAVFAQDSDDAPLQLFPTQPAEPETDASAGAPSPAEGRQGLSPTDTSISIERLRGIDPDTIGLLDGGNGGLGIDMWQGTSQPDIRTVLAGLPTDLPSPALRDLARRLLLSTAELPVPAASDGLAPGIAATADAEAGQAPESLIRIRVGKLMTMGFLEDALALLEAAEGSLEREPVLEKTVLEARLLLNDLGGACEIVRDQQDHLGEAYWQKRLVLCQLLDGNATAAQFGATLLQDTGNDDPLFFALVGRVAEGRDLPLPEEAEFNGLHLALMWLAKTPLPKHLLQSATPAQLRSIAENTHTALNIRLEAAESAARVGAIPTEMLAEIYKSVDFSSEELLRPISIAEESYNARGRALLYQAASIESVPETKALVIRKALELARANGVYPLSVDVHATQIMQLPVTGDLWDFSSEAARALYAIGRPKPAQAWVSHLDIQAQRDPEAASLKTRLWAISRLASDAYDFETDEIQRTAWAELTQQQVPDQSPFEALRRLEMTYSLIEALGRPPVPDTAWRDMLDLPRNRYATLPNPGLNRMVATAATEARRAETVAWVLWILGETGPALADSETLKQAVLALRAIGLERDAFMIGMEAALQNDF